MSIHGWLSQTIEIGTEETKTEGEEDEGQKTEILRYEE